MQIGALRSAYGLTETGVVASTMPVISKQKFESVGWVSPNCLVKIRDLDGGKSLGPNLLGEICVKGVNVVSGYFNNPQATANAFDEQGFFYSGDIGYYDEEGFIYVKDRIKELIKCNAFQVF